MWIANLRYRDSVEDKVHCVLAERLQAIHELCGLGDLRVSLEFHQHQGVDGGGAELVAV